MKPKAVAIFVMKGVIAFVSAIVLVNLAVYFLSVKYIYKEGGSAPEAQVALIPGAAILQGGGLSPIFRDRVDAAIKLYESEKVSKILVSGDNSTVSHNEVNPVRDYLIQNGIPGADIYLDHAGFDTYSTMYRARDIFRVSSIIISTQAFHLPRAVFIARSLGLKAYGVSADRGTILFKNYVREVFANEKAVFSVLFRAKPKFLGEAIPIK
ncbi:MAG TPA: ElyC/SanA/YdcF family protein [Candidatus Paceibacterota bacterium]